MDSRLDLFGALGLDLGEAHLIRNAGGQATEDALRSLLLSQRLLGTRSVMVVHHTRCGLEGLDEDGVRRARRRRVRGRATVSPSGPSPTSTPTCARRWPQSAQSPLLDASDVRGFVFDVDDGVLREVGVGTS